MLKHLGRNDGGHFAALGERSVAICRCGTEQHGPHLPAGTDALILEGILRAASALAGRCAASSCRCSRSAGRRSMAGCRGPLSLAADLLADAWVAIGRWARGPACGAC